MTNSDGTTQRRRSARPQEGEETQLTLVLGLPQDLRALPWAALRSALFAPVKPGTRKAMTRSKIAAVGDYQITYTGHQLDQADLDTFEQVLFHARGSLGKPVSFKTKPMLTQMKKGTGKSQRDWLLDSLSRLTACEVEIKCGSLAYAGSLIQEHGRDDETGTHFVMVNPRIARLFWNEETRGTFSTYRHEQRKQLGKKQLAKWLHGFMAGNTRPLTFAVASLMELSGSKIKLPRQFRAAVDTAADDVNAVLTGRAIHLVWDLKRKTVTLSMVNVPKD